MLSVLKQILQLLTEQLLCRSELAALSKLECKFRENWLPSPLLNSHYNLPSFPSAIMSLSPTLVLFISCSTLRNGDIFFPWPVFTHAAVPCHGELL